MANRVIALPLNTYQAGTRALPDTALPLNVVQARVMFDLTHLTALTLVMRLDLDISFDGGANWDYAGGGGLDLPHSGFTLNAGVITNSKGVVVTESGPIFRFPQPGNNQRRIRGSATLSEDFLTEVSITLS